MGSLIVVAARSGSWAISGPKACVMPMIDREVSTCLSCLSLARAVVQMLNGRTDLNTRKRTSRVLYDADGSRQNA